MRSKLLIGIGISHEDREGDEQHQVDVEELVIRQILRDCVQHCCASELDKGIELDKLKVDKRGC